MTIVVRRLDAIPPLIRELHRQTMVVVAWEAVRLFVNRSPVDTGRFKGNWEVIRSGRVPVDNDRFDKLGGRSLQRARQFLRSVRFGENFGIGNNVAYGADLARGSSSQAPPGWIQSSIDFAVIRTTARFSSGEPLRSLGL